MANVISFVTALDKEIYRVPTVMYAYREYGNHIGYPSFVSC
jgi:hypothetical protein